MYQLIRKILFCLEPEKAHRIALRSIKLIYQCGLSTFFFKKISDNPCKVMGLTFSNIVGLSAGFDRNGEAIDALASLGFGFIEIGTVVPKPQPGNPPPRLFRLIEEEALINRIGFASKGMDYVAAQLEKIRYKGILGINIGKNKETPNENAIDDYLQVFQKLWRYASYITINVSSPNTPGLRALQQKEPLTILLQSLKQAQKTIFQQHQKYVPLVVKISPDLSLEEVEMLGQVLLQIQIDGVIATNTTLERKGVERSRYAREAGGLSGRPLTSRSTQVINQLHAVLQDSIPIIASGGVIDETVGREKLQAGAKLLQIYTGFIYQGPNLIQDLCSLRSSRNNLA